MLIYVQLLCGIINWLVGPNSMFRQLHSSSLLQLWKSLPLCPCANITSKFPFRIALFGFHCVRAQPYLGVWVLRFGWKRKSISLALPASQWSRQRNQLNHYCAVSGVSWGILTQQKRSGKTADGTKAARINGRFLTEMRLLGPLSLRFGSRPRNYLFVNAHKAQGSFVCLLCACWALSLLRQRLVIFHPHSCRDTLTRSVECADAADTRSLYVHEVLKALVLIPRRTCSGFAAHNVQ